MGWTPKRAASSFTAHEGWLYLAVVEDLFSRMVAEEGCGVSYAPGDHVIDV